jgi:hypothetical protein
MPQNTKRSTRSFVLLHHRALTGWTPFLIRHRRITLLPYGRYLVAADKEFQERRKRCVQEFIKNIRRYAEQLPCLTIFQDNLKNSSTLVICKRLYLWIEDRNRGRVERRDAMTRWSRISADTQANSPESASLFFAASSTAITFEVDSQNEATQPVLFFVNFGNFNRLRGRPSALRLENPRHRQALRLVFHPV